jgi:L-arabinose isomerase
LRAAVAIQKVIAEEQLDCAAFNSHGIDGLKSKKLGVMCALGATLATSAGCPVSEVGDLCTAFTMWVGRKLGGASYYTELDSAYISSHEWLLLNSGEYDLAWLRPGSKPRLIRNTNFEGVNGRGASVCAPLRVGPATLINFSPTPKGDKPYRIQYCEGTIGKKWNPEMGVGNARFEVVGDARTVYEKWLFAGPVHHCCTSPGHLGKHLEFVCQEQGWSCLRIS